MRGCSLLGIIVAHAGAPNQAHDRWLASGELHKEQAARHLVVMSCILAFCLAIAVIWPAKSGDMLVVTGATGVCMVSYIIPVVNHLLLFYSK